MTGRAMLKAMDALMRLHSVGIVVDDLDGMVDFLTGLGFELTSDSILEGPWVESVFQCPGARVNVIQLRSAFGDSQIEVMKYENPISVGPKVDPTQPYAGQIRMIGVMFESIEAGLELAQSLGAVPIGEGVAEVGDFRITYVMGPENVIFMLAEELPWEESESHRKIVEAAEADE